MTDFNTSVDEVKSFIGILYVTGYHTLPNIQSYWSNRDSLGCPAIKSTMARERFKKIKQYLHVADNQNLKTNDKFAKVTPFNDLLNKKFLQFAIAHSLSIDEQMIAYFGKHSCKMFIKNKPIRFGYKYWCLASAEGYCFQFELYGGSNSKRDPSWRISCPKSS